MNEFIKTLKDAKNIKKKDKHTRSILIKSIYTELF